MDYEILIFVALMITSVIVVVKMPSSFARTHRNGFDTEYSGSQFLEQLTKLIKVFENHIYSMEISQSFMEIHTFSEGDSIDASHSYTFWYSDLDFESIEESDDCAAVAALLCDELGEKYFISENNTKKILLSPEA